LNKKISNTVKKLITVIFLLPVFIYVTRYPLPEIIFGQYLVILEVIIISIVGLRYISLLSSKQVSFLFFLNVLLIIHTIVALSFVDYEIKFNVILKTIRFVYYFSVTYLYSKLFYDKEIFKKIFTGFFVLSLIPFLFFLLNSEFFSVKDYYINRYSGIYGEPSALGPLLSVFIIWSIIKKKTYYTFFLLLLLIKTDSGSAYVILFFTSFFFLLKKGIKLKKIILPTLFILLLANLLIGKIDTSILTSFGKIEGLFKYTDIQSGTAGQARIQTLFNSVVIMIKEQGYFFGYGTNTWEAITFKEQNLRIFNFIHLLIISYGFFSIPIFYLFIKNAIKKYKNFQNFQNFELIMMLSFTISTIINSAQGSIIWKIAFLFLFANFKSTKYIMKKNQ